MAEDLIHLAGLCESAPAPDDVLEQAIGDLIWQDQTDQNPRNVFDCYRDYTLSIDAAMSLLPARAGYHLCAEYGDELAAGSHTFELTGRHFARVYTPHRGSAEATAATPALALTAACLRARAASPTKDD